MTLTIMLIVVLSKQSRMQSIQMEFYHPANREYGQSDFERMKVLRLICNTLGDHTNTSSMPSAVMLARWLWICMFYCLQLNRNSNYLTLFTSLSHKNSVLPLFLTSKLQYDITLQATPMTTRLLEPDPTTSFGQLSVLRSVSRNIAGSFT
jgi:hypothetical protein